MMVLRQTLAEFIGTFILVFFGCGAAVIAGDQIGYTGISFAFGLALIGAAYGIGSISGCHINPAVSLGVMLAGRMGIFRFIMYVIGQCGGAIVAALALLFIVTGGQPPAEGATINLGQNGFGPGYLGEYNAISALAFESVMTFLFVLVILGATHHKAPAGFAGLAIGLTLVAIHLVGIDVTGVSVNPARSLGPALFAGTDALSQLWVFMIAPMVGAFAAAIVTHIIEDKS